MGWWGFDFSAACDGEMQEKNLRVFKFIPRSCFLDLSWLDQTEKMDGAGCWIVSVLLLYACFFFNPS